MEIFPLTTLMCKKYKLQPATRKSERKMYSMNFLVLNKVNHSQNIKKDQITRVNIRGMHGHLSITVGLSRFGFANFKESTLLFHVNLLGCSAPLRKLCRCSLTSHTYESRCTCTTLNSGFINSIQLKFF